MADLPRDTRITVAGVDWQASAYPDETTWGEFCDANKDTPEDLAEAAAELVACGVTVMGGGAQPECMVQIVQPPLRDDDENERHREPEFEAARRRPYTQREFL